MHSVDLTKEELFDYLQEFFSLTGEHSEECLKNVVDYIFDLEESRILRNMNSHKKKHSDVFGYGEPI